MFAKIAALVLDKKPGTQFIFAGDGPLKEKAGKFIMEKGIQDRVRYIGWTDEPELFMKSIDLFLLTSLWEGIPCTLAQAASAGLPIIASDIAGNREFMEAAGEEKRLFPPFDAEKAAQLVLESMKTGKPGGPGRKALLSEFDALKMLKMHEKLYESL